MRKRERENPCGICGHYHKYEEGEVCNICGHKLPQQNTNPTATLHLSAFPTEILPEFMYLGSYDNASRCELLKTQSISRILNTVPSCQNLYRNSFTYHCLQDDKTLQFDDAIQFLDQCENDRARVLVHCMTGKSRSPAVVIAYLMKKKGWKLAQSYQWVKERRPSVEVAQAYYEQLQQYEQMIFGSNESTSSATPVFQPSLSFGFPKSEDPVSVPVPVPAFSNLTAPSIFTQPALDVPPYEFTFGGRPVQQNPPLNQNPNDISMDSS